MTPPGKNLTCRMNRYRIAQSIKAFNARGEKPTKAMLMQDIGIHWHTLTRHLGTLEKDGVISVEEKKYVYIQR